MRIAMGVEYDGSGFHGWQRQNGVRTVQACVEQAVATVADHPVVAHCAGRTDAGVHAHAQVIHFDTDALRAMRSWVLGSNVNLPKDVSINWACEVPASFHARFEATARHYRYVILNRVTRSGLERNRAVWTHRPLDVSLMQKGGDFLVGEHDFSSYRALGCQAKSPVRTVHYLQLSRDGERVQLNIGANAFLHHMVRNIAGVLMAIGRGDQPPQWAKDVLLLKDRRCGGVTAPPEGLYLSAVDYPQHFAIPPNAPGELI